MGDTIHEVHMRATHRAGFRVGEWAKIVRVQWVNNRPCYRIEFLDGKEDLWPVYDPSDPYEFRKGAEKEWW